MKIHWSIPLTFCLIAVMPSLQPAQAEERGASDLYTLISVNGKAVPSGITHEGVTMEIKSGIFTIRGDGTCTSRIIFSVQSRPDITREVSATFSKIGTKLIMRWKGAGVTTGALDGDTFTMNNEGMVFIYKK